MKHGHILIIVVKHYVLEKQLVMKWNDDNGDCSCYNTLENGFFKDDSMVINVLFVKIIKD